MRTAVNGHVKAGFSQSDAKLFHVLFNPALLGGNAFLSNKRYFHNIYLMLNLSIYLEICQGIKICYFLSKLG